MGNRAYVVFTDEKETEISPAVYLHWNGGPESVYAFLDELRRRKSLGCVEYAAARFAHVVGDLFDHGDEGLNGSSLGVANGPPAIDEQALNSYAQTADDNGVYVVRLGKEVSVRRFTAKGETCHEWTKREVERERRAAYKHAYHVGDEKGDTFAKLFESIRPKVSAY